jgi:hypothetical protein
MFQVGMKESFEDANTVDELKSDIKHVLGQIHDTMIMGDTIFGKQGHSDVTKEIKERNSELQEKKDKLEKEIDHNERMMQRSNRDFTDVKDTLPDPQPKRILHFIEDYTLAFLSISYLFMMLAVIYWYVSQSTDWVMALLQALISSVILTIFLFMLLYYLA